MKEPQVIIYENEADEKVYIKVPAGYETLFQLQNLAGKIIQEAIHSQALHDFDLTGLAEGNYFIIVKQRDFIKSKKIIKGYQP
jgi:hypothetical protein